MWLWNRDSEFTKWQHPAMWYVALGWHAIEFAQTSAILEFYIWFQFRPHHRSRHVILHQSPKFYPNRTTLGRKTTSSAVAKRPRDASCLSVVSFVVSIVQYLERSFFIISYFGFGFTSAYNSIQFCCLRRNVEPCCHTHNSRSTVIVYSARARLVGLALQNHGDGDWLSRVALGGRIPAYPQ